MGIRTMEGDRYANHRNTRTAPKGAEEALAVLLNDLEGMNKSSIEDTYRVAVVAGEYAYLGGEVPSHVSFWFRDVPEFVKYLTLKYARAILPNEAPAIFAAGNISYYMKQRALANA